MPRRSSPGPHSAFHVHEAVLVPDGDVAFALPVEQVAAVVEDEDRLT